jgi:hypothetical protein
MHMVDEPDWIIRMLTTPKINAKNLETGTSLGLPDFVDVVCLLYSRMGEGANVRINGKQSVVSF